MRKALIGILMAATMATPAAAQRHRERADGEQVSAPAREERQAQRAERQAQRVERQAAQQAAPQNAQPNVQVARTERSNTGGQGWQGRSNRGSGQSGQSWQGRRDSGAVTTQQVPQTQRSWRGRSDTGTAQTQQSWRERRGDTVQTNQTQQSWRDRRGDTNQTQQSWRDRRTSTGQTTQSWQGRNSTNQSGWDRNRSGGGDWNRDGRRSTRTAWNRTWRNDRRYDWQRYRYSNRNIFRIGNYYSPYRNYRYNRLSIGFILDSLFYSNRYWLSDPWQYRLPPAYPGTRWIRYYNDVLLIDVYSGEVIDVIYDFFW